MTSLAGPSVAGPTASPLARRTTRPPRIGLVAGGLGAYWPQFPALLPQLQRSADRLAYCGACPLPEIANTFERFGIPFRSVSGYVEEVRAWQRIGQWVRAAGVRAALRHGRHGLMGHLYPGMLDLSTDLTLVPAQLGGHLEVVEFDDLRVRVSAVTDAEVESRMSLARDGASLLTARGTPVAGEYDLRTSLAMLIMDRLGAGGSFTELQALNFQDNVVEMGHDGPAHLAISSQKPLLRGLGVYHGKRGWGVSVEFDVTHGPVTLCGLTQLRDGHYRLVVSEGQVVGGPLLKIGNTTSRVDFGGHPGEWIDQWSATAVVHHWALGTGHRAADLRAVGNLLGVEVVEVTL